MKIAGSQKKNRKIRLGMILVFLLVVISTATVVAVDTDGITKVLKDNRDLFHVNNIGGTMFRYIGWQGVSFLVWVAENCAKLFDECFNFIDFTNYEPVETFIDSWHPVFFALISLSILFLGLILIFWQEKKPKLAMNICLAVLIITSSGYLIDELNGFVSSDVRSAIINDGSTGGSTKDLIYDMVGSSVYDLIYLDDKIDGGLMKLTTKNRKTYDDFTKEDLELLNINEIVKPDDVKAESKDLMSNRIYYKKDDLELKEIYNGVAWTDLLNEYYYRYDVAWFTILIGLISMILVYLCLAYKVVRILYEIVVQRLLAVLYAANLSSSQKTLKILDSIKDSYITLILVMVCLKIYLLAFKMIGEQGFGAFSKNMILLFIAFAVIDGPNIIQKLTGVDAGLSSGMGKMIAGMQATRMMSMMMSRGAHNSHNAFKGEEHASTHTMDAGKSVDLEGTKENEKGVPPERNGNVDLNSTERKDSTATSNMEQSNFENDVSQVPETEATMGGAMEENTSAMPEESGYQAESEAGSYPEGNGMEDFHSAALDDLNGMDPLSGERSVGNGMERMDRELSERNGNRPQSGLGKEAAVEHGGTMFRSEWKDTLQKPTITSSSPLESKLSRSELEDK